MTQMAATDQQSYLSMLLQQQAAVGSTPSLYGYTSRSNFGDYPSGTVLFSMLESGNWAGALARISSHPTEVRCTDEEGRTPLHVACDHDAPPVVVQAMMKVWPDAAVTLSTESNMTPLHVICSSSHASVHVVRVLIELGSPTQFRIKDLDGDLALHTACRCGAPLEVLDALLRACPEAAQERDLEGLTPLLRLWVRYYVTLGDDVIQSVKSKSGLKTGELGEAWGKTERLLRTLHGGCIEYSNYGEFPFIVHAAAAFDCPRPIVMIAARVYPDHLSRFDKDGCTPLIAAAKAPVFKVRNLSEVGYGLEDMLRGDFSDQEEEVAEPSVLEVMLNAEQTAGLSCASVPDRKVGRLPLHWALHTKKRWNQGVKELVEVYSEALATADPVQLLFPFQLAAAVESDLSSQFLAPDINTIFELLRANPSVVSKRSLGRAR